MVELLYLLGTIFAVIATASFGTFVVAYGIRVVWRGTQMGRHLMTFMAVLFVILLYVLFIIFIPVPILPRMIIRLLCFGGISVIGWWRVYLLFKTQKDGREGKLPPEPMQRKEWKR